MPATLEDFMKMEGVDPSVKADAIKAWQEDTDSVIASKYGKDSEEYKAGSYHLANDVNSALQKLQVPTLQPESPLKTAGRAFASKIFPAIGTALGAYGGEELAGLAGIESGPGALATSVLGGVAGGALGGMGAQKLQNLALGDDAAENERQMRVNAEASPFASQLGGIIPTILSLGGSGGILKATEAAAGRRAATEGIEQVAKALPSKLTSVVDSAIAGARLGASDTAQQWVNGEDVDGSKLADNMARNAVQFGPLGLLGHAETILKSVMQAPSQAAITTLAGALYDNVAHGKPINPTELAKQTGAEAPGFAMFNAVASTLARHPIYKAAAPAIKSPEIAAKEERITQAADQASLAGLHETAAALDQTKTKLEQPVQEAVPITEESKPETPASEPVVQPAVEEPIIDSTAINTKPIVEQPTPKENAPIQDTIQEVVPEERESGNQSREAAETSGSDSLLRPEESAGSTADIPRDDGIPREESQEVQVNEPIPAEIAPDRVEPTPENAEEAKAEASVEPRNEAQGGRENAGERGVVKRIYRSPKLPPLPDGMPPDVLDYVQSERINMPLNKKERAERKAQGINIGGEFDSLQKGDDINFRWLRHVFKGGKGGGKDIDTVAQSAFENGLIGDPSPESLLNGIRDSIRLRRENEKGQVKSQDAHMEEAEKQRVSFERATENGPLEIHPDDLQKGDVMTVDSHKVEVSKVNYNEDGYLEDVELKDGPTFGVQHITPDYKMFVDKIDKSSKKKSGDFVPEEKAQKPKTDLLEGRSDEPFNLFSESNEEKRIREAKELKAENDRKIKESEKARLEADKQQGRLFSSAPEGIPSTAELAKKASEVAKGEVKADVSKAVKMVIPKLESPEIATLSANEAKGKQISEQVYTDSIKNAIKDNKPIHADSADSLGIPMPYGYKKVGDLYVHDPKLTEQRVVVSKNTREGIPALRAEGDWIAKEYGAVQAGEPEGPWRVSVFEGSNPEGHASFHTKEEAEAFAKARNKKAEEKPKSNEIPSQVTKSENLTVEDIPKRHEEQMRIRAEEDAFNKSNHVREGLKEEFKGLKAWTPEKIEEGIKYLRGDEKADLTDVQKRALTRVKDKILGTQPTEELSAKGFTGTKEAVDKARENYRFFETILAANPDKIKGAEARIKKAEADIKKETDPEKLHDLKVEEKNARQELEQLRNEKKELPAKLEEARKRFNSETELHSRIEANTPKLKFSNAEIPEGDKINDNARRDAVRRLNSSLTGRKIVKGVIFSPDWQRVLSHPELKDRSFTPDDMRAMKSAEGFHDPVSGKTVVITDNVRQKPGETPAQAVFRVIVHERVGHEGAEWMKDNDPAFRKAWHEAVKNIPQEELDALKKRYPGLDSDRLIGEWFAQKAGDLDPNEVPDPKTAFGKIWQAIKDFISRTFGYSSKLDQQVRDLVGVIARHEMALDGRERNGGVEFSLPTKEEAREAVVKAKGLKEFTPVRKVIGEFNAKMQATDIRLKDFQKEFNKELKRTLDKDQQARLTKRAMGAYIQSDGDVATLKKWADGSKGAEKAKYEAAQNLNPEQKTLAKQIMDRYEELHEKAVKSGIMSENAWKENYLTQLWERPATRKGQQDFANFTGKLSKSFKFGKQRTFENYFEGEQAGFKAKTDDPSELLAIYESALEKTIATRQLAKDLTEQKASDGNPLAVPVGAPVSTDPTQLAAAGKAPADDLTLINASSVPKGENDVNYQRINNPALSKWKWIDTTENGHTVLMNGELAVHPEAYTHIKNMLGRSAIKEWYESPSQTLGGVVGKNLVRLTDVLNSQIKGSMLSLSPFHIVQEGTHAVGHGVSPFSFEKIDPDNPAHADAMRHGLMLGGDNSGMNQWMEGVKGGGWMTKIPGLGKTMDAINDFTFHEYIPGLKLKTYDAALKRNMERYKPEIEAGKVKEADVKALTAEQINNAYGHLNYRDMGANPTIQHLLRLSFLAPDFLLARAGFTKEAIKGIADKSGREQLKAMAVLATTFFISSRILNALANDGDMKTKEAPFGVVVGGREYTMRSVPEDIYKALTEPRKFASGRLSPLTTRPAMDLLTGRNYRGESISSGQVAKDTLLQAVPLSARSLPWLRDLTESSKNNPISPWEQFIGSLGLHVNRYSPITEVHKLANKFAEGKGKPAGSYPTSAYTPLKNKLADANMQEARVEFQKLYDAAKAKEPKLTRQQINQKLTKSVRESLSHYFTGERALDEEFKKSLKPEEKALYKAAMGEREKIWKRYQKFTSQHLGDLRVS